MVYIEYPKMLYHCVLPNAAANNADDEAKFIAEGYSTSPQEYSEAAALKLKRAQLMIELAKIEGKMRLLGLDVGDADDDDAEDTGPDQTVIAAVFAEPDPDPEAELDAMLAATGTDNTAAVTDKRRKR